MTSVSRRTALAGTIAATGLPLTALGTEHTMQDREPQTEEGGTAGGRDRDYVIQAGMTEAEADCWEKTAEAAGAFFRLPVLHAMDKQEVATAIHVLQNKLLGRPTYRKYLELAKAGAKKR